MSSLPARIAFMKELLEEYPQYEIDPVSDFGDCVCGGCGKDYYLYYYSGFRPNKGHYHLPVSKEYQAEIIDTWNMTRRVLPGTYTGAVTFDLPARPYILVRFAAVKDADLSAVTITPDSSLADAAEMPNGYKLLDILKTRLGEQYNGAAKFLYTVPLKTLQQFAGISDETMSEMLAMVNTRES